MSFEEDIGSRIDKLSWPGYMTVAQLTDVATRAPAAFLPIDPPQTIFKKAVLAPYGVYIGKTKHEKVQVYWNFDDLMNGHVAILGMSGSGKSFLQKQFLIRLWKSTAGEMNILVIDPENEYESWIRELGGRYFRIGENSASRLNILEPPTEKTNPYEWALSIRDIFTAVLNLQKAPLQAGLLKSALEDALRNAGITHNPNTWRRDRWPTLRHVYTFLEKREQEIRRSGKTGESQLLQSLLTLKEKLHHLVIPPTDYFSEQGDINLRGFLASKGNVLGLSTNKLPKYGRDLVNWVIVNYIRQYMEHHGIEPGRISLLIMLDEAHILFKREDSPLEEIVRQARKYGFAIMAATQMVSDVKPAILSNMGTVVLFRITEAKDASRILQGLGVDNEHYRKLLASLPRGECLIRFNFRKGVWKSLIHTRVEAERKERWLEVVIPRRPRIEEIVVASEREVARAGRT
mgnify:CR=1 FL=1